MRLELRVAMDVDLVRLVKIVRALVYVILLVHLL